jgi:mycoredoxin
LSVLDAGPPGSGAEDGVSVSITMYSTTWCGYCQRLKAQLGRAGIEFDEVNIETDADAAVFVASVNGGNMTVPTVRFADGETLTNPSIGQVKQRLASAV